MSSIRGIGWGWPSCENAPVDFEDCGFGYWLWDIAVALSQQSWTEKWFRHRDSFLDGYAQVCTLPESQLQQLDLFLALDSATVVLWASQFLRDDPGRRTGHEAWRDGNGARLLYYLTRR